MRDDHELRDTVLLILIVLLVAGGVIYVLQDAYPTGTPERPLRQKEPLKS